MPPNTDDCASLRKWKQSLLLHRTRTRVCQVPLPQNAVHTERRVVWSGNASRNTSPRVICRRNKDKLYCLSTLQNLKQELNSLAEQCTVCVCVLCFGNEKKNELLRKTFKWWVRILFFIVKPTQKFSDPTI